MAWSVRVRGPKGQATLSGLAPDTTVHQLQALLAEHSGVAAGQQEVLSGFPPKSLQLAGAVADAPISSLGISNGDSLTVRELPAAAQQAAQPAAASGPPAVGVQHGVPSPAAGVTPSGVAAGAAAAPAAAASTATLGGPAQGAAFQDPSAGLGGFVDEDDDPELAMAIAASLADTAPSTAPAAPQPPRPTSTSQLPRQAHALASNHNPDGAGYSHPTVLSGGSDAHGSAHGGAQQGAAPTSVALLDGRAVVRRVIDADNSCLFNAVGYVMDRSRQRAADLRRTIAAVVASDPVTYNEGFLGMENEQYCRWILQPDKWGGAIELSILSSHYAREIAAYDIQTQRCDLYGQDAGYTERVMLLYDGLHYDAMAVAAFEGGPEELDVTILEPARNQQDVAAVEQGARQLVEACHKARQFTDTANFTLRCGVCQIGLKGEKEAVQHAKATGHQNFSEY